jgi:hypothetical protein
VKMHGLLLRTTGVHHCIYPLLLEWGREGTKVITGPVPLLEAPLRSDAMSGPAPLDLKGAGAALRINAITDIALRNRIEARPPERVAAPMSG